MFRSCFQSQPPPDDQKQDQSNSFPSSQDQEDNHKESIFGVEAIVSNKYFNENSSVIKRKIIYSLFGTNQQKNLLQIDPMDNNVYFLDNISALFKLLRENIKKLSKVKLFKDSDRSLINYSLLFGSTLALYEAKNKIMGQNNLKIRNKIKEKIEKIIKKESQRTSSIIEAFKASQLFSSATFIKKMNKLQIGNGNGNGNGNGSGNGNGNGSGNGNGNINAMQKLLQNLSSYKFENLPLLKHYLRYVQNKQPNKLSIQILNFIAKQLQLYYEQLCQDTQTSTNSSQLISMQRQCIGCALLLVYLSAYLFNSEWLSHIVNYQQIEDCYLFNVCKKNGLYLLSRIMSDAPLKFIIKEVQVLKRIYQCRRNQ